jgi:hypothetical protein
MLNKGFRVIWVKINIDKHREIHLNLPVSLYVFQELLDCLLDLTAFVCFFVPKTPPSYKSASFYIHASRELLQMLLKLFDSFTGHEAYELVEVASDNVRISIKVR